MLGPFWDAVGGRLADSWWRASGQALVFWLAVLAAWVVDRGGPAALGPPLHFLERQSSFVQAVIVLAVLFGVACTGVVVQALARPVLRLLEGYWPAWAGPLRDRLVAARVRRAVLADARWQAAYARVDPAGGAPDAAQLAEFSRWERRRRRRPAAAGYVMPTAVGDILRAAERRVHDKYGLDAVAVWPRLWPLLPTGTQQDLIGAGNAVGRTVTATVWGVLLCAAAPLTVLAPLAGAVVVLIAVRLVLPGRAETFGGLLEAAFDLHRVQLYRQLRWPLPGNPGVERTQGALLTSYLWRGSDADTPTFTPDDAGGAGG